MAARATMVTRESFRASARTATHTRREPSLSSARLARMNPTSRSMRNPSRVVGMDEKKAPERVLCVGAN